MKRYFKILAVAGLLSAHAAGLHASASATTNLTCQQAMSAPTTVNCGYNGLTVNVTGGGNASFGPMVCNTQIKVTQTQNQACKASSSASASVGLF